MDSIGWAIILSTVMVLIGLGIIADKVIEVLCDIAQAIREVKKS
jgi:hypothetical protein